jgi:hypothetical protein
MFERINNCIKQINELEKLRDDHLTRICIRLHELVKCGLVADCLVLGKHVWQIPANDSTMTDALGYVYQPALKTSQGFGVVTWKALDYLEARDKGRLETDAESRFCIMWCCMSFPKALAIRSFQELIARVESGEY